jgi:hypothetical protein
MGHAVFGVEWRHFHYIGQQCRDDGPLVTEVAGTAGDASSTRAGKSARPRAQVAEHIDHQRVRLDRRPHGPVTTVLCTGHR